MSQEKPIAWIKFTDGPRPVYVDEVGQYTYDYEGEKVHGVWFVPPGEVEFCDQPIHVVVESSR